MVWGHACLLFVLCACSLVENVGSAEVHYISKRETTPNVQAILDTLFQGSSSLFSGWSGGATSGGTSGSTTAGELLPRFTNCPGSLELTAPSGQNQVRPTWSTPSATDADGNSATVQLLSGPNDVTPIVANGTQVSYDVIYSATDRNGYTSHCSFQVKIKATTCQGQPPSDDDNAVTHCPENTYGMQCTKRCKAGYHPATGGTNEPIVASCQEDGTWTPSINSPECQKTTCNRSEIDTLQNGHYECDSGSDSPSEDETCFAVCEDGYQATRRPRQHSRDSHDSQENDDRRSRRSPEVGGSKRNDTRMCGDDGLWKDPDDTLGAPECLKQPELSCGSVYSTHFVNNINEIGAISLDMQEPRLGQGPNPTSVSRLQSPTGGSLHLGSNEDRYQATTDRSMSAQCVRHTNIELRQCPFPWETFSDVNLDFRDCRNLTSGSECAVRCQRGYAISMETVITCTGDSDDANGNGTWTRNPASTSELVCQVEPCPSLVEPRNGTLTCTGTSCTVSCDTGFELAFGEQTTMTCDASATEYAWSPEKVPTCIESTTQTFTRAQYTFTYSVDDSIPPENAEERFRPGMFEAPLRSSFENIKASIVGVTTPTLSGSELEYNATVVVKFSAACSGGVLCDFDAALSSAQLSPPPPPGGESHVRFLSFVRDEGPVMSCDLGYFENPTASGSCTACPPGKAFNQASGSCESCEVGHVTVAGTCQSCPPGSTTVGDRQGSPRDCIAKNPAGTMSALGYGLFRKCDKGTFSAEKGATSCMPCPPLTTTAGFGSNSSENCVKYDVKFGKSVSDLILETTTQDFASFSIFGKFFDLSTAEVKFTFGLYDIKLSGTQEVTIEVGLGSIVVETIALGGSPFGWVSLVGSYDHTANKISIYLDRQLVKEIDLALSLSIPSGSEIKLSVNLPSTTRRRRRRATNGLRSHLISDLMMFGEVASAEIIADGKNISSKLSNAIFDMSAIQENRSLGIERVPSMFSDGTGPGMTDPCDENPCRNGGTCTALGSLPRCQCPTGFKGHFCEREREQGRWANWASWGPCSSTCGTGTRTRSRQCLNLDNRNCSGDSIAQSTCKVGNCTAGSCRAISGPSITCGTANDVETCRRTCATGSLLQRTNGSTDSIQCGPDTGYQWTAPVNKLPKCQSASDSPPKAVSLDVAVDYPTLDCGALDSATILVIKTQATDALPSGTNAVVNLVSSCDNGAKRRKRNTGSTITLSFSIPISSSEDLNIEEFYSSGTVSPSLLEVVTAIDALNLTAASISGDPTTLNVEIGGTTYTVDTSSVTTAASVSCEEGLVSSNGFCSECGAGTYYSSGWCVYCDLGYYQDETGSTSCKACSSGLTTSYTGSTSVSDCIASATEDDDDDDDDDGENKGGEDQPNLALAVALPVVGVVIIATVIGIVVYKVKFSKKTEANTIGGSFTNVNKVRPSSAMSMEHDYYTDPTFGPPPSYSSRPPSNTMSDPPSYSRANSMFDSSDTTPTLQPEKTRLSLSEVY